MSTPDVKHESGIRLLIDEFGGAREREIRTTYQSYRDQMERSARVETFIPVLAFAATKQSLLHQHHR
ncbi:three-helix bundle dimerization domain-containing protein [Endothiovibrio diazotrophicus]